ncbi:MAG: DNA primase small subunit domain-containing protein [Nitrososphaerota archaeon]|nr:hypothetical protein [Nitrososphaerales archaeon]MDW8044825.1 DNA primase small subunit domain-containing protein [Nitrososphaerota archaeon]
MEGSLDEKTLNLMKQAFKQYYFKAGDRISPPSRMNEREFGYIPFGGSMIRHLSFKTFGELYALLVREAPHSVFYSAAYYLEPTLPMHEKGWKGGDLIFDIDADNLQLPCRKDHNLWTCKGCGLKRIGSRPKKCPNCDGGSISELNWACEKCLEAAKNEALKLIDILMKDFGINKNEIKVYFSGNMGYHVSVESKEFEELDQAARGEIADYVSGRGLIPESIGVFKRATYESLVENLPRIGEPGWRGRLAASFANWKVDGFGDGDTREKIAALYGKIRYSKFKKRLEVEMLKIGVRIDTMVTTDIHRIFRMPGTLHGETGLLKMLCDDLVSFNPLNDAVVLSDEPVDVFIEYSPRLQLKDQIYPPFKRERVKLPLMVAVYLAGKCLARVV